MNIKIELEIFTESMADKLGDIPNAVIIIEDDLSGSKIRRMEIGCFSFNNQCFFASGDKISNKKIVAFGTYDIMGIQSFVPIRGKLAELFNI